MFKLKNNGNTLDGIKAITTLDASTQTSTLNLSKFVNKFTNEQINTQLNDNFQSTPFEQQEKSDHRYDYNLPSKALIINDLEAAPQMIVNELESALPLTPLMISGALSPAHVNNKMQQNKKMEIDPTPNYSKVNLHEPKDVQCIDLCPPEDIRKNNTDAKLWTKAEHMKYWMHSQVPSPELAANEPTVLGRMRQLDISFLKPEDFQKCLNRRDSKESNDYSLNWCPKAVEPSLSYLQCTSKESMILNSTALKNMNDEQLTKVAKHTYQGSDSTSRARYKKTHQQEAICSRELTVYGIPANDLSKSSIQYLEKNRLVHDK